MYVLIHSPLVGPFTWSRVAAELERRHLPAIVPRLRDDPDSPLPFWEQHARSAAEALAEVPRETRLILVGHSGAGPLLPAIRARLPHRVAGYVFVDAGIPRDGWSHLDAMRAEVPEWANELETFLRQGGRFPNWDNAELEEAVPDPELRQALLGDVQPRPYAFFTEPLPVPQVFPDAPCAFLQFSAAYDGPAAQARASGWAYAQLDAGHFALLTRPGAVAEALTALVERAR
jgi:pimeloyl-ACP methyl ester carboxylesterase